MNVVCSILCEIAMFRTRDDHFDCSQLHFVVSVFMIMHMSGLLYKLFKGFALRHAILRVR